MTYAAWFGAKAWSAAIFAIAFYEQERMAYHHIWRRLLRQTAAGPEPQIFVRVMFVRFGRSRQLPKRRERITQGQ